MLPLFQFIVGAFTDLCSRACPNSKYEVFSGPHFRLPRFDSPLTTPSEVKINGRRILPVINYYIQNALFVKCLYPSLYPVI